MKLVQRWSMCSLNTHDVPVIVQPGQSLSGHVPKGFFRLLFAKKAGTTFQTVHSIHVESGSPQWIQFHRFGVGVTVQTVLVSHCSIIYSSLIRFYRSSVLLVSRNWQRSSSTKVWKLDPLRRLFGDRRCSTADEQKNQSANFPGFVENSPIYWFTFGSELSANNLLYDRRY